MVLALTETAAILRFESGACTRGKRAVSLLVKRDPRLFGRDKPTAKPGEASQ